MEPLGNAVLDVTVSEMRALDEMGNGEIFPGIQIIADQHIYEWLGGPQVYYQPITKEYDISDDIHSYEVTTGIYIVLSLWFKSTTTKVIQPLDINHETSNNYAHLTYYPLTGKWDEDDRWPGSTSPDTDGTGFLSGLNPPSKPQKPEDRNKIVGGQDNNDGDMQFDIGISLNRRFSDNKFYFMGLDEDGISTWAEINIYGTNTQNGIDINNKYYAHGLDSDHDGVDDRWEIIYQSVWPDIFDPTKAPEIDFAYTLKNIENTKPNADSYLDPDGDGLTPIEEYQNMFTPYKGDPLARKDVFVEIDSMKQQAILSKEYIFKFVQLFANHGIYLRIDDGYMRTYGHYKIITPKEQNSNGKDYHFGGDRSISIQENVNYDFASGIFSDGKSYYNRELRLSSYIYSVFVKTVGGGKVGESSSGGPVDVVGTTNLPTMMTGTDNNKKIAWIFMHEFGHNLIPVPDSWICTPNSLFYDSNDKHSCDSNSIMVPEFQGTYNFDYASDWQYVLTAKITDTTVNPYNAEAIP